MNKGRPITTMADMKRFAERQRDQGKREAKLILRFEPKTMEPRSTVSVRAISGNVIYIKDNRHYAEQLPLAQLDRIEVFRPFFFEVQTPDGDLWVESVKVNGHENLAGGGASSLMFNGKFEIQTDSGKPQDFEITLRNDGDEPRRFAAGMEGRALLKEAP